MTTSMNVTSCLHVGCHQEEQTFRDINRINHPTSHLISSHPDMKTPYRLDLMMGSRDPGSGDRKHVTRRTLNFDPQRKNEKKVIIKKLKVA